MRKIALEKIRNIGIIAHIDAGKTTTTERVLFYTGRTYKIGEVDEGTATMDWMVQEQERGITITAACTTCQWRDFNINLIDTPGHVDFTIEVERSLKVLDGAIVVFCAVGGVEPQSETVWRQADQYGVPRIAFVNKMDRVGANFSDTITQMHKKLGANAAAIQMPFFRNDNLEGIIDLLEEKLIVYKDESGLERDVKEIPEDLIPAVHQERERLLERLAEVDEKIMDAFVHARNIEVADIKTSIRRNVIQNKFVPVLCGAALRNKGIQLLLDAICDYLPAPSDLPPIKGTNPDTGEFEEIQAQDEAPFSALCFKVSTDPYVGRINYVRVYSGTLNSGDYVWNASRRIKERVSKLLRMHANRQEVIESMQTGNIAAVVGLKDTKTGDSLCSQNNPILIEAIRFPEPVIQQAIEPKSKQDQERLGMSLQKLAEEDPSFRVSYNQETGETIISGMGQLHLEIAIDRILREFNVEAQVGAPQVAYRETITRKVVVTGKFIQQTGGHGQYGHVVLEMQPQEMPGLGITFEEKIKSGVIPREFIPSVEEGVRGAAKSGFLVGYPVTDVKVVLTDGSYHEVDSSEMSFKMAAAMAFNEGLKKAGSILLEPIMDIEVIVPEESMGTVISDLNSRRAKIVSLTQRGNVRVIRAYVPLGEMFYYATALRSLTQGRASYTMEPSFYAEVPSHIADKIIGGVSTIGTRKSQFSYPQKMREN